MEVSWPIRFDHEAAEEATVEGARKRLRVIKHYVRYIWGDHEVNRNVHSVLTSLGVEPELPWSVFGSFQSVLKVLRGMHRCRGLPCVKRLKDRKERFKTADLASVRPGKQSVARTLRKPARKVKVGVPTTSKARKAANEVVSYYI